MLTPLDVERVRADFPALAQVVHGHPLAYLDNASTTQKPRVVLDTLHEAYETCCANVHRGVHTLSATATRRFEAARATVARCLGGVQPEEVVFTRGTTEAINLVAQSWGRTNLGPGDRVLVSQMEHHSNIVPWQLVTAATGAKLDVLPMNAQGDLRLEALHELLTPRTRLVAVAHVSNALGTVNPVAEIVDMAHAVGAKVLVDGAQATPHMQVDLPSLGADFYALSGHKAYAPMGIGALFGRAALLESMPPWQGGGEMITEVTFARTEYADPPQRFEAGTPNVFGAIALAAALEFLEGLGLEAVARHESALLEHARASLAEVPGVQLIGRPARQAGALSFVLDGAHPHDVGTVLDTEGVAVRTGHHCAQPVMEAFDVPATVRASFGVYNTREEVERLAQALLRAKAVLGV